MPQVLLQNLKLQTPQPLFKDLLFSQEFGNCSFDTHRPRVIFAKVIFTQLTLHTLGISAMECSSFRGKWTSRWRNLRLALELVLFCFCFWTHWQALLSLRGNTQWLVLCSYQRWRQDVPSPWPLDFWNSSYGIKREGTFISWVWLGQDHYISCIWVFSNFNKGSWGKKLK